MRQRWASIQHDVCAQYDSDDMVHTNYPHDESKGLQLGKSVL